jgi:SAM-dependent methyltransferase
MLAPITRRFFLEAGIESGMRVLDVGSGAGDVAFLAVELVGESGEVVGVDRSATALTTASNRARSRELPHVSFRVGDPSQMTFERPFDAAVGRYVLEFQPDPAAILRGLAAHVRDGGVIVFHELDFATEASYPPAPTHDQCVDWWTRLLPKTGADPRIGIKLHSICVAAGLPAPSMKLEAIIGGGESCSEYLRSMADLIGTVVDDLERHGIAKASEIGSETLAIRMIDEVKASGSVVVGRSEIGAWTRK